MNPADFPEANFRLLAPPSMPECLPLSVHRYPARIRAARPGERADLPGEVLVSISEPGGYISRWEPTPEERAAIAVGGPIWVGVTGNGAPPPIWVSGVTPFEPATINPAEVSPDGKHWRGCAAKVGGPCSCYGDAQPAREAALELCHAIERLPASGRQTEINMAASDLLRSIEALGKPAPTASAAEVYGILSRTDETRCLWCGRPYGEHSDVPLEARPKMPCVGEKAHFVDARARGPLSSLSVSDLRQRKAG